MGGETQVIIYKMEVVIMDISKAKEIIGALAEGIDPITGEILPPEHVCNNADVVRAFYALLQQGNAGKKEKNYENSGKRWTDEEDELLKQLYDEGMKISEIQRKFMRSRGSIQSRLAKLGLIEETYIPYRR